MTHLEIIGNKVVCPRCNNQGRIYKTKVVDIDFYLYICDECDATWEDYENISIKTFQDLQTYLESHNSKYISSNFEDLGYDWFIKN